MSDVAGSPTTWADVNQGDVVEGSNNSLWSVTEIDDKGNVSMLNVLTGVERTGKPSMDKEVIIVTKAQDVLATAKTLAVVTLGGEEMGTKFATNSRGEWMCPPDIEHAGALYSHLLVFHGVYGVMVARLPLSGLQAFHATIHDPSQRGGGYVVHVHDPDYRAKTA